MNLMYVLLVLQVLDLISTVIALRNPANYEANPILAPILKVLGPVTGLVVVKAGVVAALLYLGPYPDWFLYITCAGYAYVVYNNFKLPKAG